MKTIYYLNGKYIQASKAFVSVDDRGFQFSDGIYEVIWVCNGKLIDINDHFSRLKKSLHGISLKLSLSLPNIRNIISGLIERNKIYNGYVYIQITRGIAKRDHQFPKKIKPTILFTLTRHKNQDDKGNLRGIKVVTLDDFRWHKCNLKSISLLANVLSKQQAIERGAAEGWFVRDGFITEGSTSNAWIITKKNQIITHPTSRFILPGVARNRVLKIAKKLGEKVYDEKFTVTQAMRAKEAFITSTTKFILPVTKIDNRAIGNKKPGPITEKLRSAYLEYIRT